jgi:hypothetical protein
MEAVMISVLLFDGRLRQGCWGGTWAVTPIKKFKKRTTDHLPASEALTASQFSDYIIRDICDTTRPRRSLWSGPESPILANYLPQKLSHSRSLGCQKVDGFLSTFIVR